MAKANKKCVSCGTPFEGRRDARTCSARCRKRMQRAKSLLSTELDNIKQAAETGLRDIEALVDPRLADEKGFVGDGGSSETQTLEKEETSQPIVSSTLPVPEPAVITPPPPFDP